jgi:multidrug efflux pump subunit AcrA (membrane-fusion protein)
MGSQHAQRKLGELLVDTGALDDDALEDALLEQQVSRKRLGAIRRRGNQPRSASRSAVDHAPSSRRAPRGLRAGRNRARSLRLEILARNERIAELETQLATSERERRQLVEALQVELTRSRTALQRYRVETPVLPRPPMAVKQPASPVVGDANYLLLVPDGAGSHALRTSAGQPPAVGSQIAIAGQSFVAVSHRRSPIDADERVCLQLEPR